MIFSAEAAAQVEALRRHYRNSNRIEAVRNLIRALAQADILIERDPAAGLSAPRSYTNLASTGRVWTKAGRYWIAHTPTRPSVVPGVFYETADIPNRI